MPQEIERKFLVKNDAWRSCAEQGIELRQAFIFSKNSYCTTRIRIAGPQAFITIKGKRHNISRAEYEYEIPVTDAEEMLRLCDSMPIEKTRYPVICAGHTWVVDVFHQDNAGLVLAEIELTAEDEPFETPEWAGEDVSKENRYCNSNLAKNPYKNWKK